MDLATSIFVGHVISTEGYDFKLTKVGIDVLFQGALIAIIPTMTDNGINYVRTLLDLESEASWWIARNT